MNDDHRKDVEAGVRRGDEAFESAEILLAASKHADAVSRAYYAVFHHARAMLLTVGDDARPHGDLARLLQRDLVRSGQLDPDVARLFSRLQKYGQDADYIAEFVFTANAAREQIESARRFVEASRALLRRDGWLAG